MLKLNLKGDIYLISDIHANLSLFKESIKELDLTTNYLFVLGDLIEKGEENIKTLDYLIDLINKYEGHIYIVKGNCDLVFDKLRGKIDNELLRKYSLKLGHTILNEFLEGINVDIKSVLDYAKYIDIIKVKYKKYYDFIDSIPLNILINDNILLTHADISESDSKDLIKKEDFYKDYKLNVVGHMPVMMYKKLPSLDPNKIDNVLYIDGGNNVVRFGGLNLVKLNLETLDYRYKTFTIYKDVEVVENQRAKGNTYIPKKTKVESYVDKGSYYIVKINGEDLYVETLNLVDKMYAYDATNIFLPLKKGEIVKLVKVCDDLCFILKDNTCSLTYTRFLNL